MNIQFINIQQLDQAEGTTEPELTISRLCIGKWFDNFISPICFKYLTNLTTNILQIGHQISYKLGNKYLTNWTTLSHQSASNIIQIASNILQIGQQISHPSASNILQIGQHQTWQLSTSGVKGGKATNFFHQLLHYDTQRGKAQLVCLIKCGTWWY